MHGASKQVLINVCLYIVKESNDGPPLFTRIWSTSLTISIVQRERRSESKARTLVGGFRGKIAGVALLQRQNSMCLNQSKKAGTLPPVADELSETV